MKVQLQITAHNIELNDFIREDISEKAEKLDTYYDQIMRCRVVVDVPHRHKHEGILYDVHIYMTIPGGEIVIKREQNEDLAIAIRDAFDAARRKLEDYARRQNGRASCRERV